MTYQRISRSLSELGQAVPLDDVAGWTVSGRHGQLGHVVPPEDGDWGSDEHPLLLVRGGTSHALFFHVPLELVTTVARGRCDIRVRRRRLGLHCAPTSDGSVDLFLSQL